MSKLTVHWRLLMCIC